MKKIIEWVLRNFNSIVQQFRFTFMDACMVFIVSHLLRHKQVYSLLHCTLKSSRILLSDTI